MTTPNRRRLALISKHFPPSEEAGALRWQKLTSLADGHGFDVTAAVLAFHQLSRRDDRRLAELPSTSRVIQVESAPTAFDALSRGFVAIRRGMKRNPEIVSGAPDGARLASAMQLASISRREARPAFASVADLKRAYHATALRAAELAWAKAAASALEGQMESAHAVVSCGPPHQVHIAGSRLAARWGVPHVVDMRDPWSLVERVPDSFGSRTLWNAAQRDEAHALERASLIVVNTFAHAEALARVYPRHADRIVAILNGFDDEPMPTANPQQAFTLVYAGTVYLDRDPGVLLAPIAELVRRNRLPPSELQIVFVGDVEVSGDATLEDVAAQMGLADFVRVLGRVPRAEAMKILAMADMNVVLPQDSHLAVPSKVYEYLRFPSWLLAFAEAHSATAMVLSETGADVLHPSDREGTIRVIARRMEQRRHSGRPTALASGARHLSRQVQAELLFNRIAALRVN